MELIFLVKTFLLTLQIKSVSDKDFFTGGMGAHMQEELEDWEDHCNISIEKFKIQSVK